jgi:hypothetical protein
MPQRVYDDVGEAGVDINTLAAQLPIRHDENGFRIVDQRVAAAYLASVRERAARALELERTRAAAAAADDQALARRRRVRALRAQQGTPADPNVSAYATMIAGTDADRLAASSTHLDEMLSNASGMVIHKITRED